MVRCARALLARAERSEQRSASGVKRAWRSAFAPDGASAFAKATAGRVGGTTFALDHERRLVRKRGFEPPRPCGH